METALILHNGFANTVLLFMLAIGFWGLFLFFSGAPMTGSFWGALVIGEIVTVVEGLVGVSLYLLGDSGPARGALHILYGIVAMICLPAAFSFTRGRSGRQEALVYAAIAFFLAGIAYRARTTGMGG